MAGPKPKPVPSPTPPSALGSLAGMSPGAKRYVRTKYKDEMQAYITKMTKFENYKSAMAQYKKLGGK